MPSTKWLSLLPGPVQPDSPYCWIVLVAAGASHFILVGLHYSFGLFFPRLLDEFDSGEGNTAWIGSVSSGMVFFFALVAVKVMKLTSVWITCFFGGACAGIGLVLNSFVKEFGLLYVTHSLLFGIGTSLLYTPTLVIIAQLFTKYRELATGIVVACGSLGQLVLSVPLERCLDELGLRLTYKLTGMVFVVLSCLCACAFFPIKMNPRSTSDARQQKTGKEGIRKLLCTKAYRRWLVVMLLANFTYYIPIVHLVNFVEQLGSSQEQASYLQVYLGLASLAGRILFGKIANTFPAKTTRIYQAAMFLSGMCSLAASFSTSYWHVVLFAIVYGLLDGSYMGLLSIVTLRISGLENFADAWGFMLCLVGLPMGIGPAVVGWVNDAGVSSHRSMFYFAGFPMVVSSLLMFYVIRALKDQPTVETPPAVWTHLVQHDELKNEHCLTQRISVV